VNDAFVETQLAASCLRRASLHSRDAAIRDSTQGVFMSYRIAFLFLVFLFTAASALAQPSLSPVQISNVEKAITTFMSQQHAPSVSVAIVKDGNLAWTSAYGFSDLENSVPAKISRRWTRLGPKRNQRPQEGGSERRSTRNQHLFDSGSRPECGLVVMINMDGIPANQLADHILESLVP
jgi:hypothetical protein